MATPALQAPPLTEVTLSLFGGMKTDIAPADCPEGISPDNQDGIFLPGDWQSRPGLHKLFDGLNNASPAFPGGVSVLYQKTYVQPDGDPLNLFLTSDGKLWLEDVAETPKVYFQIGSVPAGLSAQSVTAFGREYIAISDLLHGQGVPLQYDGSNLDRVTQDGPGAPVSVADESVTYGISASPNGLLPTGTNAISSISESGNLVTAVFTSTDSSQAQAAELVGAKKQILQVKVLGVATGGYNGTYPVTNLSFLNGVGTVTYLVSTSGLAGLGAGGTVQFSVTKVVLTALQSSFSGDGTEKATISGAGVAGYNATWTVIGRILNSATIYLNVITFGLANSGNGTLAIAGNISPGKHGVVQMFLTRQGALTRPSPPAYWTSAGSVRAVVSDLAIGPTNIVARVLGFTGAGGALYFVIPVPPTVSGTPVGTSTLIPDNTSTQVIVDFADNTLFAGISIDQIGNNLFDQRVLGPVLGFFAYASRLLCWGDYNKVENFLNMGFDGGYAAGTPLAPTGWTVGSTLGNAAGNGELYAVSTPPGFGWAMFGGAGGPQGLLSQSAYQDANGTAIILPNTLYDVRVSAAATANSTGNLIYELSSASTGFITQAAFPLNGMGATPKFYQARLGLTPAAIPADLVLKVYGSGIGAGQFVTADEGELIYEANPYNDTLARISYVLNPEGFAQTTGNVGAADDASPIRCFTRQRRTLLLKTGEGRHTVADNDFEPYRWVVDQVSQATGALSLRAGDPGKFGTGDGAVDWDVTAAREGIYLFAGADFWKISQEISRGAQPQSQDPRPTWNDINWAAEHTLCLKNDSENRRILIAAPINGALAPNILFVLDYRELDTAIQIASAAPVHITLAGKMKSSDLSRKWTRWNLAANCLEVLVRPGNDRKFFLAGGNFGNTYYLDPLKLRDDDFGQMTPYYDTYFFVDHDQEQQLQLGAGRKLVKKISAFITGVGRVTITPLINSLYNFQPPTSPRFLTQDTDPSNFLGADLEWSVNLRGQRIAFRIQVEPLPGASDVQIKLQKFIAWMQKDAVATLRSGVI